MKERVQKIIQGIENLKTIPMEQRKTTVTMLKEEYDILRSKIFGLTGGAKTAAQKAAERAATEAARAKRAAAREAAAAQKAAATEAATAQRTAERAAAAAQKAAATEAARAQRAAAAAQGAAAAATAAATRKSDRISRAVETLGERIQECIDNINENDFIFKIYLLFVAESLESIHRLISQP